MERNNSKTPNYPRRRKITATAVSAVALAAFFGTRIGESDTKNSPPITTQPHREVMVGQVGGRLWDVAKAAYPGRGGDLRDVVDGIKDIQPDGIDAGNMPPETVIYLKPDAEIGTFVDPSDNSDKSYASVGHE